VWRVLRPWLFPVWCLGCGAPEVALCAACRRALQPSSFVLGHLVVRCAAAYDGIVRDAVLALKRGERAPLDPLGELLAALVPAGVTLIPLPTGRRRAALRGFDQARALAQRVVAQRGGRLVEALRKRGPPQHGRSRVERLAASGRFALRPGVALPARAVLLDDVVTTGATLLDAAATLRAAGCRVNGAVVVARTETAAGRGRLVGT
jgi:predicted amidophosphoribosyltransferase